jgi:hypothetical protein
MTVLLQRAGSPGLFGVFCLLSVLYGLLTFLIPIFLRQQSVRLHNILTELRAIRRESQTNPDRTPQ